jgi:hypothetical protein
MYEKSVQFNNKYTVMQSMHCHIAIVLDISKLKRVHDDTFCTVSLIVQMCRGVLPKFYVLYCTFRPGLMQILQLYQYDTYWVL